MSAIWSCRYAGGDHSYSPGWSIVSVHVPAAQTGAGARAAVALVGASATIGATTRTDAAPARTSVVNGRTGPPRSRGHGDRARRLGRARRATEHPASRHAAP